MNDYIAFLSTKGRSKLAAGFAPKELNSALFPFQRACVERALKAGRFALFEDCGCGKTLQQGAWADAVAKETGGRVLIIAPLCVSDQTIAELARFGIKVGALGSEEAIQITNYERIHKVNPDDFGGVVLDESSILKSCDGKTRGRLIEMFSETPYRLACTATPAPNDQTEFGNHAEFLGVLSRAEMLASFFVNKGQGRQSWQLKGHARESFFEWLSTWSVFVSKPSDMGFDDEGFDLPPLDISGEIVETDAATPGHLFFIGLGGVSERAAVRRETLDARVKKAAQLIKGGAEQAIAWCGLNKEQELMAKALGDECVSVSGSDSVEQKRAKLESFLSGSARVLVTKPKIAGFGMNFQCAPRQVFVGLGDSYEAYYQAIRRSWRFGQKHPVNVSIVLSDQEREVAENVMAKEREAIKTQKAMAGRMAVYQRGNNVEAKRDASIELAEGPGWKLWHGDCIEVMRSMEDESIDHSVFSPPFASLYTYSASERDMGNSQGSGEFFEHFKFFVPELLRVMKSGRIVACHCQQIPKTKNTDGVIGVSDFRGDLIRAFEADGFIYHGEVTIDKCPQAQAIRTKSKSLLFVQLERDSSWSRPAFADYILLFRKPGENKKPIKNDLSREDWIEWARPVWYGIRESDTLSAAEARDKDDEKHICPLQLGTIERCVRLWSNKGERVWSPFAGIGSEGYQSILLGREFWGAELKPSYWRVAKKNLDAAVRKANEQTLFSKTA